MSRSQKLLRIRYEERIRHDDVPVEVQVEARAEALAEGDGRALRPLEAERLGQLALPALDPGHLGSRFMDYSGLQNPNDVNGMKCSSESVTGQLL